MGMKLIPLLLLYVYMEKKKMGAYHIVWSSRFYDLLYDTSHEYFPASIYAFMAHSLSSRTAGVWRKRA